MNHFVGWLAPHLLLFVAVITLFLATGCGVLRLIRSPAHRQRIGELTVAAVLIWLVLAAIPLPRLSRSGFTWLEAGGEAKQPIEDDVRGAHAVDTTPRVDGVELEKLLTDLASPPRSVGQPEPPQYGSASSVPTGNVESPDHEIGISNPIAASMPVRPATTSAEAAKPEIPSAQSEQVANIGDNRKSKLELAEFATRFYLAAAAVAAVWLLLGHALLARERFTADAPAAWLYKLLQRTAESAPGRLPRLVVSRRCSRPLSWGLLRPMIALPERLCQRGNCVQLRTILLHELGHVRRCDARGNLLFELAFPLLWFHPLYWWLRSETRMAAELVADDWASQTTGKEFYVAQLVALARGSRARRLALATGNSVLSSPSQFYRRMNMLLAREKPLAMHISSIWRIASAAGAALAVAMAAALAGVKPVAAGEPEKPVAVEAPQPAAEESPKPAAVEPPSVGAVEDPLKPGIGPIEPEAAPPAIAVGGGSPEASDPTAPLAAPSTVGPIRLGLPAPPVLAKPSEDPRTAVQSLQAERQRLHAELLVLMARLEQLERASNPTAMAAGGQPPRVEFRTDNIILLTRAEKNGHLVLERWTADANGKPSKVISKTLIAGDSPIAGASPAMVEGNIVVKELTDKNGTRWVQAYQLKSDGSAGRLIESHAVAAGEPTEPPRETSPAAPPPVGMPAPVGGVPPTAAYPGLPTMPAATPSFVAGEPLREPTLAPSNGFAGQRGIGKMAARASGDATGPVVSTRPIDLVALATSYADAVSAVEIAKAQLADAERTSADQGKPQNLNSSRAAIEAAIRKEKLLRRIAEVAANGAKHDYARAVDLHNKGAIATEEIEDRRARLEILEQILGAREESTPPPKAGGTELPK